MLRPLLFLLYIWQMEQHFINPALVSCSSQKQFLGGRSWYCNKIPILWIFVDIIQHIFNALMEEDNLSQNKDWPYFCGSIRNTSVETHILRNFLHRWNFQLGILFLETTTNNGNVHPVIYFFQLIDHIVSCFNYLLLLLIRLYIHFSSDLSLNHIILCIFMFILCHRAKFWRTFRVYTRQFWTTV